MITNERQYRVSKAQAEKFVHAIERAESEDAPAGVHPRIHAAMVDALKSQLEDVGTELEEYEALRSGKIRRRVLTSLTDLPIAIIEGRIAVRMTQRDLAEKVGLPEQQIQRYEATRYSGAGLERLQEIADAIGLRLPRTVGFGLPELALAGGGPSGKRSPSGGRRGGRRRAAKRTPGTRRTTVKRTTAKRSTAKRKTAAKRTTAKRAPAKRKTAAKRTTAKRTAAKRKTPAKRTTAKRTAAKRKTAAKRTTAKRTAAKRKTAAKRTTAKRTAAKRNTAAKRTPAKRRVAAKRTARRRTAKR